MTRMQIRQARNGLLDSLVPSATADVLSLCDTVELVPGSRLCEADKAYAHAWFPQSGLISQGVDARGRKPLEMGIIGNEGMLGATLALGCETAPMSGVVTGAGTALRMEAAPFRRELAQNEPLRRATECYLYAAFRGLVDIGNCIRFHEIGPRLARCLLQASDRLGSAQVPFTQQRLADMLGVRRSGISAAVRSLREQGLIRNRRGEIVILDRPALAAAACDCYELPHHGPDLSTPAH